MLHKSVLLQEVLDGLNLKSGAVVVDGTLGSGGHALEMLKRIGEKGSLIGLDQDPDAIKRCQNIFKGNKQVSLHHVNFKDLSTVLDEIGISKVDAVLLDIGISSDQLADTKRGFSFQGEGDLDMRMNPEIGLNAAEMLNQLPETELADMFFNYGNERMSRKFARAIVNRRADRSINTVSDLTETIESVLPSFMKYPKGKRSPKFRRHPATRVFQALRIAVNDELNVLRESISSIWDYLNLGGRFSIISFHSLEDRIVKQEFRAKVQSGQALYINKKPICPEQSEISENPRSRSAKLRTIERTL